jgi:hypothetical protein
MNYTILGNFAITDQKDTLVIIHDSWAVKVFFKHETREHIEEAICCLDVAVVEGISKISFRQ